MANRHSDYVTAARAHATALWNATLALKAMQSEWNAQDYGTTFPADGEAEGGDTVFAGENAGYTRAQVGAVVFATTDALQTLFAAGHATNLTDLL